MTATRTPLNEEATTDTAQLQDAEDTLRHLGKQLWVLGGAERTRPGIVIPALLEIRDYFQAEEPREWFK